MANINGKVYRIINLITNKPVYVGQTIQTIELRFNDHCSLINTQNTSYLINTYGKQYFKIELIQDNIDSKNELDILEKEYIISYSQQYDLINKIIYQNYIKQSITVQCVETQEIFPSINIAAQKYNININSISRAIQYGYEIKIDNKKLHWRALDDNISYKKRIRDEYVIYIIEQKFESTKNIENIKNTGNAASTENIINIPVYKKKKYVQCIETQEVFTSMNKAAKQYNINSNLINKSIKYGYAAGINKNGNKLHWKQITNKQYAAAIIAKKNKEKKYIWKPIYIQQTWKKIFPTQLDFHKKNTNSPLYSLLNNNDINDFRLIPIQQSSLTIIKENIKKFINIKSLNDAIEKEKQLISLLISNSYKLYNFYNNPNYIINNENNNETITIDIEKLITIQKKQQKQLEHELLHNNQQINITKKSMQVQCIETNEIFNTITKAAQKYNTNIKSIISSIKYGYIAGKIHNININGKIRNINLHWKEYFPLELKEKKNKLYRIYIIEQKIKNITMLKKEIIAKCIETNEIFTDLNVAAQKHNATLQCLYAAMQYGYSCGTVRNENIPQNEELKAHWVNINQPIYKLKKEYNDSNEYTWIPIYVTCDYAIQTKYNYTVNDTIKFLEKYKNDPTCGIYNILNLFPLENFRLANIKKYKFILTEPFISQEKNISSVPPKFKTCVQCIETKEIFISMNQAAQKYDTDHGLIKYAIKKGKTAGQDENGNKLHWCIYNNETNSDIKTKNKIENDINNNIYTYCINDFANKEITELIINAVQKKVSQYYNLYNVQLTAQNLIETDLTQSIDIIMWKLIKNNPYLDNQKVYKDVVNNIIFLNLATISRYYRISIQKIKDIIDTDQLITKSSRRSVKLISIDINYLHDNTIIYALIYRIIKVTINNKTSYITTFLPYNEVMTRLKARNRPGLSQLINGTSAYDCSIIKSHIYFQKEAEVLKNKLLNRKSDTFKCKLPVRCINTGETFSSIFEASRQYGYKGETNILYVCRGERKYTINHDTGEKLKWEFISDNDDIKMNKSMKKNNYTVFFLFHFNKLITIASSTHFTDENILLRYKKVIIYSLKHSNINLKEILNGTQIDNFIFKPYKSGLTKSEAQQLVKKLKIQYINEIIA